MKTQPQTIKVTRKEDVGLITFDRPKALNALNEALAVETLEALQAFNADDSIGAIVLTGAGRAFAAGADIAEMSQKGFSDMYSQNYFSNWDKIREIGKPIIAAVNGFALGGGCEVAMMCDLIIAGESAKFGQPEIKIGILPGIGGTQRLTRAIGKFAAMDLILTGRMIEASEAKSLGLVSRVVPDEKLLEEACAVAAEIASYNAISVRMAKEAINSADEMTLSEGVRRERHMFFSCFATEGQKEGMAAFLEKRAPRFTGR